MSTAKELADKSAREIESLLTCPICLDIFTKPVVILPCQHNLCRKCADDCFEQRGTRFGISGGRFKCPQCRYEVILDRHGTFGLPRNLLVENIIDMLEDDKKKVEIEYQTKILEEERKLQVLKTQEKQIEDEKRDKMCTDHNEKLNVYCLSCNKLICATCKVFGGCQSCAVLKPSEAYDQQQVVLREAIEMITAGSDRVNQAVTHCSELKKKVDEVNYESKVKINEQFEKIFAALEAKKLSLLSKINNYTNETNSTLLEAKTRYTTAVEKSNQDVNEALVLVSTCDKIEFLRHSHRLTDSLIKSRADLDIRPPSINVNSAAKWKIDLGALVEVVKKIDFSSDIRFKQSFNSAGKANGIKRISSQSIIGSKSGAANGYGEGNISEECGQSMSNLTRLVSAENSMTMSIDGSVADFFKTNPPMSSSTSKKNSKRINLLDDFKEAKGDNNKGIKHTPLNKLQEILYHPGSGSRESLIKNVTKTRSNTEGEAGATSMESSRYGEDDTFNQ